MSFGACVYRSVIFFFLMCFPDVCSCLGEKGTLVPEGECFGLMKCLLKHRASVCFLWLVVCAVSEQYIPGIYLVIFRKTWASGLNLEAEV